MNIEQCGDGAGGGGDNRGFFVCVSVCVVVVGGPVIGQALRLAADVGSRHGAVARRPA